MLFRFRKAFLQKAESPEGVVSAKNQRAIHDDKSRTVASPGSDLLEISLGRHDVTVRGEELGFEEKERDILRKHRAARPYGLERLLVPLLLDVRFCERCIDRTA